MWSPLDPSVTSSHRGRFGVSIEPKTNFCKSDVGISASPDER